MTRISSAAANTFLVQQIFRTQQRVTESEAQVASEKRSSDYRGIAINSQHLLNTENTRDALTRFVSTNQQKDVGLEVKETVFDGLYDVIEDFRSDVRTFGTFEVKNEERVQDVQESAVRALKSMQMLLNTDVAGRYLFAGTRVTTQPVDLGITTVSAFQATFDGARSLVPTTRSAHMADFTISSDTNNENKQHITNTNFLQFRQDSDGDATTSGSSTVEASSAMFSNVAAGTQITLSNTTSNDGTYTVESVSTDGRTLTINTEQLTDESNIANMTITYPDTSDPPKTLTLDTNNFGTLSFTRSNDTIVASTANGLSAITAGSAFTVSGSTQNDGTYTVKSNDGTNLVIESVKLTDEGTTSSDSSAATFFDMRSFTDVYFDTSAGTIEVRQSGTSTAVPDIFEDLAVGNQITITNSTNNNGTFTISAISSDNSKVTVTEALGATETDSAGVTFAGAGTVTFNYESKSQLVFTNVGAAGSDTIQIQTNGSAAITTGVFNNLQAGQRFTVSGASTAGFNQEYTISSISSDGSTLTVAEDIAATGTENSQEVRMQIFSVGGQIDASNYYSGDETATSHRVTSDRSFSEDFNAINPAIEKAIRAMKHILQGVYGTDGGLDQNTTRVNDALFLLDASLERTIGGTPPFGTELDGNLTEARSDNSFNRVLINDINQQHTTLIAFFDSRISDIENINPTEAITRLLDDQRTLQVSYQVFSRIRQLSLTNYI
ncbi:MAG: hypothetical protein CBB68_09680 [Rhodospirillaceae bacterium TMED8]|nr:hypothetical protein [Magnetovibrio sp.]OUT50129.1 MAG: hypothetical protein CBB68_09680 [Rhodospirillaceae bacterium TMED8]